MAGTSTIATEHRSSTASSQASRNVTKAEPRPDADTRTTLNITYPPTGGKWYAVVHSGPDMQGTNSKYRLCGNLS